MGGDDVGFCNREWGRKNSEAGHCRTRGHAGDRLAGLVDSRRACQSGEYGPGSLGSPSTGERGTGSARMPSEDICEGVTSADDQKEWISVAGCTRVLSDVPSVEVCRSHSPTSGIEAGGEAVRLAPRSRVSRVSVVRLGWLAGAARVRGGRCHE